MILSDALQIQQLTLGNFAASGSLGAAAVTVDRFHTFFIPQTTAGISLTLPNPSFVTDGRQVTVHNTGTTSITVHGAAIGIQQFALFEWNGIQWSLLAQSGAGVNVQVFTLSGTYTPTPGLKSAVIELCGGGGGSGGTSATTGANGTAAAGGGSGAYARIYMTAAQMAAAIIGSTSIVIGAGGSAGAIGATGGAGGNTSFLLIASCNGGGGGAGGAATAATQAFAGGAGGIAPGAIFGALAIHTQAGERGADGVTSLPQRTAMGGGGGQTPLGNAPPGVYAVNGLTTATPGFSSGFGAGGSGRAQLAIVLGGNVGVAGMPGIVIITEYL